MRSSTSTSERVPSEDVAVEPICQEINEREALLQTPGSVGGHAGDGGDTVTEAGAPAAVVGSSLSREPWWEEEEEGEGGGGVGGGWRRGVRSVPSEPSSSSFGAPWLAWVQLGFAVLAVSTAAVAFRELPDVPPLLLACWR